MKECGEGIFWRIYHRFWMKMNRKECFRFAWRWWTTIVNLLFIYWSRIWIKMKKTNLWIWIKMKKKCREFAFYFLNEKMPWVCFLFLEGKSWRMWMKMKKTMLWIWIKMMKECGDFVFFLEGKYMNEDWWNIVCLFWKKDEKQPTKDKRWCVSLVCERWMKNYQRKMKHHVLVLFMKDGWRTAKERWNIVGERQNIVC